MPIERPPLDDRQLKALELDRNCYDGIASAQATLLDKSIISIAGASFSISIGFINSLIPLKNAIGTIVLWSALVALAFSIITTVLSFGAGEKSARFMRTLCDEAEIQCDTEILCRKNPWRIPLTWLNSLRLLSFIVGMVLLSGFIFYNGIMRATIQ